MISDNSVNTSFIDTSNKFSISSFITNIDNYCSERMLRKKIKFGLNTNSFCQIRVNRNKFKNCSCLRHLMYNQLNSYFIPSDYVSKTGNLSQNDYNNITNNWIKIYKQDLSKFLLNSSMETIDSTVTNTCINVPSGVHIWFLFANVGLSQRKTDI